MRPCCARRTPMAEVSAATRKPRARRRGSSACLPALTWRPMASGPFLPTSFFSAAWNSSVRYRTRFSRTPTVPTAKDAVELIDIEYEPLPAVTVTAAAADPSAPRLWDHAPSNVCLDAEIGDKSATDAAFSRAAPVVSLSTWIQRVTGVPMETRSAVGTFDAATERYTLYAGSGGVVRQKREISDILNVPFESVRVVAHDIGGNFGTKNSVFPEHPLLVWAA